MKKYLTIFPVLLLFACVHAPNDPSLAYGVKRISRDMYSVSEMSVLAGDPARQAALQCEMDGNKKLNITGTPTQRGMMSGTVYSNILFRCE